MTFPQLKKRYGLIKWQKLVGVKWQKLVGVSLLIGMAAVLSATIHAPFTAVFPVCGMTSYYTLVFPLLAACLISKFAAKSLFPHTAYNFKEARP